MFSWQLLEHFLGDTSAYVECVVFLEAAQVPTHQEPALDIAEAEQPGQAKPGTV